MKRIMTLAMILVCANAFSQTASGDFKSNYERQVRNVGYDGVGVETIIDRWEAAFPDDPEMLVARFNYNFTKSQYSQVLPKAQMKFLSQKPVLTLKDSSGNEYAGYVLEIAMFLGIQIPRTDRIHALVNIDSTNVPTHKQLLDFVYDFGGYTPNSVIYCHPLCLNIIISKFMEETKHADLIKMDNEGRVRINGCLVVPDQNMINGTEAIVNA